MKGLSREERDHYRVRCGKCGSEDVFVNWTKRREVVGGRRRELYYPGATQCRRCFSTALAGQADGEVDE
jgi:ribosomal protein L40E